MLDSELDEARLDEPMVLSSVEWSEAILGRGNIWKQSDSPVDTYVHWGGFDYPSRMTVPT